MSVKKSIRLSDEAELLCKNLSQDTAVNWAGSINSVVSRYNILIKEALPELSDNEKNAIYCAYNGRLLNKDIMLEIAAFNFTISESIKYDSQVTALLGEENIEEYYQKCQNFTVSQKLAVLDMVQRFWSKKHDCV